MVRLDSSSPEALQLLTANVPWMRIPTVLCQLIVAPETLARNPLAIVPALYRVEMFAKAIYPVISCPPD